MLLEEFVNTLLDIPPYDERIKRDYWNSRGATPDILPYGAVFTPRVSTLMHFVSSYGPSWWRKNLNKQRNEGFVIVFKKISEIQTTTILRDSSKMVGKKGPFEQAVCHALFSTDCWGEHSSSMAVCSCFRTTVLR